MIDFFINNAYAQSAPAPSGGLPSLLMFGLLFIVFYFLLIRPQMKQAKEHKKMVEALGKGDEVVTNGGILGKINQIGDNFLVVEIAKDVEIRVQKHAVSAVMPKGTIKNS